MRLIRFVGDGEESPDTTTLHMNHAIMGGEFTACGITLDRDPATAGNYEWLNAVAVTCPDCAAIVLACRGVKVSPNAADKGRA